MRNLKDAFDSLNGFHNEYKKSLHKVALHSSNCKSSFRLSHSSLLQTPSHFSTSNKPQLEYSSGDSYSDQNDFLTRTANKVDLQFELYTPVKQDDQNLVKDLNTIFRVQREQARINIQSLQTEDLYQTLELDPNASEEDINKMYKRLCLKYHPDKMGGSVESFHRINQAYKILSNKELREMYDQYGFDHIKEYYGSFY